MLPFWDVQFKHVAVVSGVGGWATKAWRVTSAGMQVRQAVYESRREKAARMPASRNVLLMTGTFSLEHSSRRILRRHPMHTLPGHPGLPPIPLLAGSAAPLAGGWSRTLPAPSKPLSFVVKTTKPRVYSAPNPSVDRVRVGVSFVGKLTHVTVTLQGGSVLDCPPRTA